MAISAGTGEDVRRANLAAILGILYRGGSASRASLSKLTGRNRSTIASLVADLVELGLAKAEEEVVSLTPAGCFWAGNICEIFSLAVRDQSSRS